MKKILIIEDDESVKIGLIELLNANRYEVISASDGKNGIQIAKETLPDLIICDIMMPGLDGYEIKKKLDKNNKTSVIPFIFLTAKVEMNDIRTGMLLGADDYIIKPFKSSDLLNTIELRISKNKRIKDFVTEKKRSRKENKVKFLSENDQIFIDSGKNPHFIKVGNIICIIAQGNDSVICVSDSVRLSMRRSLSTWEKMLPKSIFRRIHRSTIINLNFVENVTKWSSGTYLVQLKGIKKKLTISQRYAKELRNELN